jgi:hypothetical protein
MVQKGYVPLLSRKISAAHPHEAYLKALCSSTSLSKYMIDEPIPHQKIGVGPGSYLKICDLKQMLLTTAMFKENQMAYFTW